jgi:hypothetical protein
VDAANKAYDFHVDTKAKLEGCFVEVDFGLDWRARDSYAALASAFERARTCSRIWDITSTAGIDRVSARTTASTAITRQPVTFEKVEPELVQTQADVLRLGNVNGRPVQIYPAFLMVREPSGDFALIEYAEIECKYAPSNFIEEEGVPPDAEQVGTTWKYANKNGGPDRRFADNYQIPVMGYGSLVLGSETGLAEAYLFSDFEKGRELARALNDHKRRLDSAEGDADTLALPAPADDENEAAFEGPPAFAAKPRNNLLVDWILLVALLVGLTFGGLWAHRQWGELVAMRTEPVQAPVEAVVEAPAEPVVKKPRRRRERSSLEAATGAPAVVDATTSNAVVPDAASVDPTLMGDTEVTVAPPAEEPLPAEPPL